jgi:hypothetical protein
MGAKAYGDKSIGAPSERLLTEIEEELLDVVGWGFILYGKIQGLRERFAEIEGQAK